jgi:hypothetical protein
MRLHQVAILARINIPNIATSEDQIICPGPHRITINSTDSCIYAPPAFNAGVNWIGKEVVIDDGLITSRSPKDLPAFDKKLIEEIAKGVHQTN